MFWKKGSQKEPSEKYLYLVVNNLTPVMKMVPKLVTWIHVHILNNDHNYESHFHQTKVFGAQVFQFSRWMISHVYHRSPLETIELLSNEG